MSYLVIYLLIGLMIAYALIHLSEKAGTFIHVEDKRTMALVYLVILCGFAITWPLAMLLIIRVTFDTK